MKRSIRWISLWFCLQPAAVPVHGDSIAKGPKAVPTPAPVLAPALDRGGPGSSVAADNYRIGPGDILLIRVARHEEMGAELTVLDDGRIMVPRIGELTVVDRTPQEVQSLVTAGLKKVLVSPEVSVEVKTPRPQLVYVSGAVRNPHALVMQPGWRVSEAVAEAGGLLVKPERTRATLFRRPNQTIRLDLARIYLTQDSAANLALQRGDNLDIQEEPTARIYVGGAVLKPGPVELPKGSGIAEAIALAGGVSPVAALSRTVVQRSSGERVPVDMDRVLNQGQPAPDLQLESEDQIIVPENRQHIAVLGKVKTPGAFPLKDGATLTVAEAVSLAGGIDPRGRASHIGVIRVVKGESKVIPVDLTRILRKGRTESNLVLQDQDIVYVPETDTPDWSRIIPGAQALGSLWYFLTR